MMVYMLDARTQRRWRMRHGSLAPDSGAQALATEFANHLRLHPLVAELMVARGVATPEAAQKFLKPKLSDLSDPLLIPGVKRAAQRIAKAIADGQPIVVYGDYDVDGITASSVMWHVLKQAGANVTTYVPHRMEEGYGLNADAIRSLCGDDPTCRPLIISVDCGITACGPAQVAKELGADLVISDHHQFDPANLPEAYALVHPALVEREASSAESAADGDAHHAPHSTLHDLCGAGVAFKLAWQVAKEHCGSDRVPEAMRDMLVDLLSLVALGTVADVVPLVGENRILTLFGLSRVKSTRFAGLNALIDAANLRGEKVSAYHVGFVLGPRLNAVGRLGHAKVAVKLLTEATDEEAREIAAFLTDENDRRRQTEREIFTEAHQMVIDASFDRDDQRAIVLGKEGWHSGVIGIVASRLVEAFRRPVVMLAITNGHAHGSARSVDGVSIHDALHACAEYLDRFGGHAMAAGLALPSASLDAFRQAMVGHVNERLAPEDLVNVVDIDAEVSLADCTVDLFGQIQMLEPFGRGNPTPRLMLRNVVLDRPAQRMGQAGNHLSLLLRQDGRMMRAVAFNQGDLAEHLPAGLAVDLVFEPKVSMWQGSARPEIHVKDLRRAEVETRSNA